MFGGVFAFSQLYTRNFAIQRDILIENESELIQRYNVIIRLQSRTAVFQYGQRSSCGSVLLSTVNCLRELDRLA